MTEIVYQSRLMHDLITLADRYARSSATVLLTGESGTGKELISEHIHRNSSRRNGPYIRVNCAALSESLVESELFGHERGSFTGALATREGRFEVASGGTLLLDEITEIPLSFQSKLLRVLEQSEFERVGDNKTREVDVRVIATTNRDIEAEVSAGRFRMDLYHRLNVLRLDVPALRERREDITPLTSCFVERFRNEAPQPLRGFSRSGLQMLTEYDWPGNVRELRNVILRACVLAGGPLLGPDEIPDLRGAHVRIEAGDDTTEQLESLPLDDIERHVILKRLRQFNGNKTAAANALGVTPRTLTNKIARYREHGYI